MDFRINRETIPVSEIIYSGIQEHGIELDYILPDYCPDVFRLIRCDVCPVITDSSINGDKLTYELQCDIKLLYCSDDNSSIQCISQRQNFSKSVELGRSPESPEVEISAKSDHINFRAVNKRRLDVRGAVSVKVAVIGEKEQEVITDAYGMNIQLKKMPVKYASKKISAEKIIQLSEDTEIPPTQPDIISVIRSECIVSECEKKIVSGKILAKGDINIKLLCSSANSVEAVDFSMPFSQIIDMETVDESFDCIVSAEVTGCNITVSSDGRTIKAEPDLKIKCKATKISEIMVAEDAFSTVYPCECEFSVIQAEQPPTVYAEKFRHSAKICEGEEIPKEIFAMWCSPKNINTRTGNGGKSIIISGMLTYSMACVDSSGNISMPDKEEAFEEEIEIGDIINGSFSAEIRNIAVSYNISSEGVLNAKADIAVNVKIGSNSDIKALTAIAIDDTVKKERDGDYAIKLYFSIDNEDIWDIAKRCSTEIDAITEENELVSDKIEKGGMLVIPIKN